MDVDGRIRSYQLLVRTELLSGRLVKWLRRDAKEN